MTTTTFRHIDTNSYTGKPWGKVDGDGKSFKMEWVERPVHNIRGCESEFDTNNSGFAVYNYPAKEKTFTDDEAVREGYYKEVEQLLRDKLPGIKKVHIFDHTVRRQDKASPRQPVQQVHVDQTPGATDVRVRRHLGDEAEELLKGRYQIINVWRPISHPASDFPLAVVDWRSTEPADFIPVDLMYPKRADSVTDDDDRGKEILPDPNSMDSTAGYEVKGETLGVRANTNHKFYYQKDMTPDEVMLLKCYDSYGNDEPMGKKGIAVRTPHTAFVDPNTPKDAPGRQSIEVRCLIFYE
ncbi:Aspirochlorine biosynthesis protein N [Pseudocercospora fuligena]|uniref:Aspirochlorine biosynthesis protein N n=1 Tax=Pseudocercospora fuligena TaxID=685502 RepID=A0A8H6RTJ8_9PEZI|nr:Aspirochlorine biosynthesis protein N [Pseudocercospora fuligena]